MVLISSILLIARFFSMEEDRERSVKVRLVSIFLKPIVPPEFAYLKEIWHKIRDMSNNISMLYLNNGIYQDIFYAS